MKLEVLEASHPGGSHENPLKIATGMELAVSELQMPAGSFRFRLRSGVVVGVTGPAELQFFNPMHLRVIRGKVTADVGEKGKGFIVDTAQTRVVDLGTRFGVDVAESGHTDVVVFQGEVELYDAGTNGGAKGTSSVSRLVEGQAVRVNVAKEVSRISSVSSGPEGDDEWSTNGVSDSSSIITAVHDNLHNPQSNFYYRILRGGMREDARAFIAKRHEWNGLNENGLPDWLVGADLVQTFPAGDRKTSLQITVTTAMPTELYVIVDSRVPPPAWLAEEFEDTGVRIGLENAPLPDSGIPIKSGPGNGNLAPFAVWKRSLPEAGDHVLGPPPLGPEDRPHWMYGIAARKL
ncbi:MAG: Fe2+-dicitrate sensor protein [Verrucomicrobiaceae bacterium]|nr:MAG: Fe2+-dicitrate sensor protein [Verrucomicrobiaceae bacterium]